MTYGSINDEENDDPHTSAPFLTRPDHILQMMSEWIADDFTIIGQMWLEHMESDI